MKRFVRGRQYVNILLTLLLALSPLKTVAQCIDATDSAGNVYCGGLCTGVNCSIPLTPPCTYRCWTGTEDCCKVIGANFVMTNYQRNRLTFYDHFRNTHDIFAEDGEVSTQSLAQVAVIPGSSIVLLPVIDKVKMFARNGRYLGVFYQQDGALFNAIRFWNSTLLYLNDYNAHHILRLTIDFTTGDVTTTGTLPVPTGCTVTDMTITPDGQLLILTDWSIPPAFDISASVFKNVNDTEFDLVVHVVVGSCPRRDAKGIQAFEDYTFAISCRSQRMLSYYALDGTALYYVSETSMPNSADAFSVRQGPRDLTYVTDFTGFNKPLVFYHGILLGQLGSWGYLSSGMFLDFFETEAYTGTSSASGVPETSIAGVPFNVTVYLRNNDGEPILVPTQLSIEISGYMLMSNNVVTLSSREVTTFHATNTPGAFVFTVPNEQATLAYPDSSGEMYINPVATGTSEDPATFTFTASVVVGPFHQIIDEAKFYVAPGPVSTTASTLALSGQSTLVAGEGFAVMVYLNDRCGNPVMTDFNVSHITATVDGAPTVPTSIADGYPVAVNFNLTRAGPRLVYIYHDNAQISNPVTAVVQAGSASPLTSIASGPGLGALALGKNSFSILPKDKYGNALQYSVDAANLEYLVTITLFPSCYHVRDFEQYYDSEGLWQVSYTVEGSCGEDLQRALVSILLAGTEILTEGNHGEIQYGPTTVFNTQVYEDESLDRAAKAALIVLGALGLGIGVLFHILIHHWRNTNVIKFSQRRFLHVIIAGAMLSFCDVIARGLDASDTACISSVWFYHLGFTVAFSSLFAKAWRVTCIAHMTMRRMKISDHAVFRIILLCIATCGGYLVAWTLVDPPAKEDHEADDGPNRNEVITTTVTSICTFGDHVGWVIGITVAEIVGLLYGSLLAYQNRDIHDAFSESKWTGIAIYNMMVQMLFVSAMSLLFKVQYSDYNAYSIVTGVIIWLGTLAMICLIALPKFYSILRGEEVTIQDFSHNLSRSRTANRVSGGHASQMKETSTSSMSNLVGRENSPPLSINPIYHKDSHIGSF